MAEAILCDTSFVSHRMAAKDPRAQALEKTWTRSSLDRLGGATLAISPFVIAELRSGFKSSGWGDRRIARANELLRAYLLIGFDFDVVDQWAVISSGLRRRGITIGHNDIWIAATARSRDIALVTMDQHFKFVKDLDLILLPGKAPDATK